ncbi:MAG TPA: PDZ domain-containing protein [Burkholderiaceae bacterium]|nr:PDZ domain-containing protein [Burkholderiaceae bacterium]
MSIFYAIRPASPAAHLFHVTCRVERPDPQGQLFMLPAWIPGSYMIREFARNIVRISALGDGRRVALEKLDKHTWRAAPAQQVELAYEVYAWDLSVRAAHLDETHGFFNGTSVFLLPAGMERQRCVIDILPPAGARYRHWRVATALAPARGTRRLGFGAYEAADYDELIDCPVEMGDFQLGRFDVLDVPHQIVITGRVPKLDMSRLTTDLAQLCETQVKLFEPRAHTPPFERYSFLTMALGDAYGGLEHRSSTALVTKREGLPFAGMTESTEAYRNFLGLASHEYFHSWLIKRIKPAAFVPYDLSRENHTRLLWAFEGFTSYYDDLLLTRAGLLSDSQYLSTLAKTMTTVTQRSSRLKQSAADSSFDAWIKYYRQDENAPNSVVSYYQKGSLIGLAIDLSIRAQTKGKRSLDDVMRLWWKQWKSSGAGYAGVTEEEVPHAVQQATGLSLDRDIAEWSEGTRDPDYAALLAPFGVICVSRPDVDAAHFALLGIKTASMSRECKVVHVFDGSPAQIAGLSGNDILVSIGGLRATPDTLDTLLSRYATGDAVEILAFRRDELMRFDVRLATQPPIKFSLEIDQKSTRAAQQLRQGWLGKARVVVKHG